jgi:hypothetical protein
MKNAILRSSLSVIAPLACSVFVAGALLAADGPARELAASSPGRVAPLPSADDLIQRVLDRSAKRIEETNATPWAYDKRTIIETLDSGDKVKERTERLYRVRMIQGLPFSQLVKIEGRDLTEAEIQKENERERSFQKQLSGRDPAKDAASHKAFITKDIMDRYACRTLAREMVHGRQTIRMSFEAKPGQSDDSIQDRVLTRLAGIVWVEETTGEIARLEVRLTKGFSIGILGILGSLKSCQMELACIPMTDGTWLPEKTKLSLSLRVFLSNTHFQMEETSSNFALETTPGTTPP